MPELRSATDQRFTTLGPIQLAHLSGEQANVERIATPPDRPGRRVYSLLLQARGSGQFTHYGHRTMLREGDILLCDSAAPHSYRVEGASEWVLLQVPAKILEEHLPSPHCFCGRALGAASGLTHALAALVLSLCTRLDAGLAVDFQERVARHLLDMIATSYAIAFDSQLLDPASMANGRYAKVRLLIEQHLRDPDLSPATLAEQLKVSSRYLRMIFAAGNEKASAYILRRRLEECARQISDPRWSGRSITEIAFGWGFNSASHFTRSFREHFGASPRNYRRLQLNVRVT